MLSSRKLAPCWRKLVIMVLCAVSVFAVTFVYAEHRPFNELLSLAKGGNVEAQYFVGKKLIEGVEVTSDSEKGVKWVRRAADQGHAAAQFLLGILHFYGELAPKDKFLAKKWVQKAADNNLVQAQYILGNMFHQGYIEKNLAEAVKYYGLAVEQGYSKAQLALAIMYEEGEYLAKSEKRAANLYRKAAEQSDVNAQILLGGMYEDGRGVSRDYGQAMYWYTEAKNQGDARAQWLLGMMHKHGKGVPANIPAAREWINRSCVNGFEQACADLRNLPADQGYIDERVPDIRKAAYDLFRSSAFKNPKQKYKTAHDQLTRFWFEEDFQLKGVLYHSKFFATQYIDESTGEPYQAHATGAKVSVVTYKKNISGQWERVSLQEKLTISGSWGDIYSDNYVSEYFSPSSYGVLFEFGYSAQGHSEGGRLVYVFHKNKWHDTGFVQDSGSNEGSGLGAPYSFEGEIYIGVNNKETGFPDLLVERAGTEYQGVPAKGSLYRFDGNEYKKVEFAAKEALPTGSQPSIDVSNKNTRLGTNPLGLSDEEISLFHDKMEVGIAGANAEMASKRTDALTTIKSITYDRIVPEVIYTYHKDQKIAGIDFGDAMEKAENIIRQQHIQLVCGGPMVEFMRILRFRVTQDYDVLHNVTIYPEDCE